ncbi:MAG: hypothetical protein MK101_09880 [Phycisphaerales bacterium]|nr:hypothetical protein [Phycisphaerales bacterium]
MPAMRSRTAGWRRCLEQICDRRGSIELAIERAEGSGRDLLLRARLLKITPEGIEVEAPVALGERVLFEQGAGLVGVMAVGQNRWMFRTTCTGHMPGPRGTTTLQLGAPMDVQRCQRRADYRIDTAVIDLPEVSIWPLLDPTTAVPIERLAGAAFLREVDGREAEADDCTAALPATGPSCQATLVNLGGGGVGLSVPDSQAGLVGRHAMWWMRFELPPALRTPVACAARIAHSHVRSDRTIYLGMSFDFSANPQHRRTVSQQLLRALHGLQGEGQRRCA